MENKNLLIAILLCVGFLFAWSTFVMPRYAPPRSAPAPAALPSGGSPAGQTAAAPPGPSLVPAHAGTTAPAAASETIFRDPQNEVVVSPKGGGIRHWRLSPKGHEVDLVHRPDVEPLPLATYPDTRFNIQRIKNGVAMKAVLNNGLRLTKTLTLNSTGYLHDLGFRFENPTSASIEVKDWQWGWGPGLGTVQTEMKENSGQIRALSMSKLNAHALKPGEYSDFGAWAGIDNRYFLVAFIPVSAGQPKLIVAGTKDAALVKVSEAFTLPPGGKIDRSYQIYAGPKGYTQLGHYHKSLEASVDFGFFSPLGKLVLRAIYWLQERTRNYGWAIIILTIGLQILLFPLTLKSTKAQNAMKKLQPQIAELQKNYKSDPKRLNIEMMNLYKKSGTNPLGGCLPMLLQMPIFLALFTTLRNAYELRDAPFIGWITDLSAPDTIRVFGIGVHILPIIMGVAMFFQQRMSGAITDPTQKQIMMLMPVVFTVMMFNFPSGLVLYWLTNNLFTMAFTWVVMRYQEKPPVALVR